MRRIAIDICNTLADINSELVKFFGVPMQEGVYFYPLVNEEWFKNNLWIYEVAKPLPYAKEVLEMWSKDYEILYLTARPREALFVTKKWLNKYGFPDGKIISSKDKAKTYKAYNCSFAVDDSPAEVANYIKSNCDVKVVKTHYTVGFDNLISFDEIFKSLNEKISARA